MREFFKGVQGFIDSLRENGLTGQTVLFIVQFCLLMVVASFEFVLSAYAAMCVGQLANRHRTWASIGAYFGLNIAQSFFMNLFHNSRFFERVVTRPAGTDYAEYARRALVDTNQSMALLLLETVAICAAMFFLSSILLKKKLNLQ